MTTLVAIVAVGAISYALRVMPLLLVGRVHIPESVDRAIRHASVAALAALLVGALRHSVESGSPVAAVAATTTSVVWAVRGASLPGVVLIGGAVYAGLVNLGA